MVQHKSRFAHRLHPKDWNRKCPSGGYGDAMIMYIYTKLMSCACLCLVFAQQDAICPAQQEALTLAVWILDHLQRLGQWRPGAHCLALSAPNWRQMAFNKFSDSLQMHQRQLALGSNSEQCIRGVARGHRMDKLGLSIVFIIPKGWHQ
jgi:hypothetical protein